MTELPRKNFDLHMDPPPVAQKKHVTKEPLFLVDPDSDDGLGKHASQSKGPEYNFCMKCPIFLEPLYRHDARSPGSHYGMLDPVSPEADDFGYRDQVSPEAEKDDYGYPDLVSLEAEKDDYGYHDLVSLEAEKDDYGYRHPVSLEAEKDDYGYRHPVSREEEKDDYGYRDSVSPGPKALEQGDYRMHDPVSLALEALDLDDFETQGPPPPDQQLLDDLGAQDLPPPNQELLDDFGYRDPVSPHLEGSEMLATVPPSPELFILEDLGQGVAISTASSPHFGTEEPRLPEHQGGPALSRREDTARAASPLPEAEDFGARARLEEEPSQIGAHQPTEAREPLGSSSEEQKGAFLIACSHIHLTLGHTGWGFGDEPPSPRKINKKGFPGAVQGVDCTNEPVCGAIRMLG